MECSHSLKAFAASSIFMQSTVKAVCITVHLNPARFFYTPHQKKTKKNQSLNAYASLIIELKWSQKQKTDNDNDHHAIDGGCHSNAVTNLLSSPHPNVFSPLYVT